MIHKIGLNNHAPLVIRQMLGLKTLPSSCQLLKVGHGWIWVFSHL